MTPTYATDSFQSPLVVQYLDGRNWIVREAFVYHSPRLTLTVPDGFRTDFASIPWLLRRWMEPTDRRIGKPSIIHDYLYRTPAQHFTRYQADYELREAMRCVSERAIGHLPAWARGYRRLWRLKSFAERWVVFAAVRCGGRRAFRRRRQR